MNKRDEKYGKSENGKKKRPERKLYVPPALRSRECEDTMGGDEDNLRGSMRRRTYSMGDLNSFPRNTHRDTWKVQFHGSSSSSNSIRLSKDEDSTDFEDCCSVPKSDEESSVALNEENLDYHLNNGRKAKPEKINLDVETENWHTGSKTSNRNLMKYDDDPDAKFPGNQLLNFEPNAPALRRKFFFRSDESISEIDAIIDDKIGKGRVSTSTPNSNIEDQMILDAAKYVPVEEESGLESTVLHQSDTNETTINKNRTKFDYNFEIYHDPSSVKSLQADYLESSESNYIPPPVPAPSFQLPPIPRLSISSPYILSAPRCIPPPKIHQFPPQPRRPRFPCAPSVRLHLCAPTSSPFIHFAPSSNIHPSPSSNIHPAPSSNIHPSPSSNIHPAPSSNIPLYSSYIPPIPRCALSQRMQPAAPHSPNPPYTFSSPSTLPPRERFNLSRLSQDAYNIQHLHQRNYNSLSLESHKQDDSFYIPPPVPRPQQIRNIDQKKSIQSSVFFDFKDK